MACPNQHFYYDQYGYGYPVYTYAAYPLATYTTTPPQQPVTAPPTAATSATNAPPPPLPTQTIEQPGVIYEQYQHYTMPEYPSYTQYTTNCANPNANNSNNVTVPTPDQPPQPIITVGKVNLQKPKSAPPPPPAPTTSTKPVNSRLQPQNDDDMANQIKAVVEIALSNHGLSKVCFKRRRYILEFSPQIYSKLTFDSNHLLRFLFRSRILSDKFHALPRALFRSS